MSAAATNPLLKTVGTSAISANAHATQQAAVAAQQASYVAAAARAYNAAAAAAVGTPTLTIPARFVKQFFFFYFKAYVFFCVTSLERLMEMLLFKFW